jgi:two-component system, cell cycle sensor histidine kinase and response regulator CckA
MRWELHGEWRNEMQQAEFWPQNGMRTGGKTIRLLQPNFNMTTRMGMQDEEFEILVMTGNPSSFQFIQEIVAKGKKALCRLTRAETLSSGLEQLAAHSFDAVLLELNLPDSKGIKTLSHTHSFFREVPILVLAGDDDDPTPAQVRQAGAQDYLYEDELDRNLLERALRYAIEQKRLAMALYSAEAKFSKVSRCSPDSITISTLADGRLLEVNETFVDVTGYEREEALGQTAVDLGLWTDPGQRRLLVSLLGEQEGVYGMQVVSRMKGGELREFILSAESIYLGRTNYLLAVTRDITEQKRLLQQSREAHRSELIGRLAYGVAHDFHNWLAVMLGHCELLLDKLSPADPARSNVLQIKKAVSSAVSLTRQLREFSRDKAPELQVIDLNHTIAEMGKMLRCLMTDGIEMVTRLEPPAKTIKADVVQIEQVLLNLALNARDAMPAGGKLLIETTSERLEKEARVSAPELASGLYAVVAVSDTGSGMDANTMAHIFEPYFSTKGSAKGTGLGLALVNGIVKQSGGAIVVSSEVGKGTTFKVYLPFAQ